MHATSRDINRRLKEAEVDIGDILTCPLIDSLLVGKTHERPRTRVEASCSKERVRASTLKLETTMTTKTKTTNSRLCWRDLRVLEVYGRHSTARERRRILTWLLSKWRPVPLFLRESLLLIIPVNPVYLGVILGSFGARAPGKYR